MEIYAYGVGFMYAFYLIIILLYDTQCLGRETKRIGLEIIITECLP